MLRKSHSKNENWSQAFYEFQSKVMRKMEVIWQEKWEIVQKENNSLKGRMMICEKKRKEKKGVRE